LPAQRRTILGVQRDSIESAINALDSLLKQDSSSEKLLQDWFENHPDVFVALGYADFRPHPTIVADDGRKFIPDFLVRQFNGSWVILELKTPQTRVLREASRRATFYAEFAKYVSQCAEYSESLDSVVARRQLTETLSIEVQKRPQSIIVAGRDDGLDRSKVQQLCARINPPLQHSTFDDIRRHLDLYRTRHFRGYDNAHGFGLFAVARLHPAEKGQANHIFDIGAEANRNHISVFVDADGYLTLLMIDADGLEHRARAAERFTTDDYELPHFFYFDAGTQSEFSFLTVQMDGNYRADIRSSAAALTLSQEYAMGTNADGTGQSWMAMYQLGVLKAPASFAQKSELFALGAVQIAEIIYNKPNAVIFSGLQSLSTQGHSSRSLNQAVESSASVADASQPARLSVSFAKPFVGFGSTRAHAEHAIRHATLAYHLRPLANTVPSAIGPVSLFAEYVDQRHPFYLLVITFRHGAVLTVAQLVRVYPDLVSCRESPTAMSLLEDFLAIYGVPILVGDRAPAKLLAEEVVAVANPGALPLVRTAAERTGQALLALTVMRPLDIAAAELMLVYAFDEDRYVQDLRRKRVHIR
jgi:hypothetical protein